MLYILLYVSFSPKQTNSFLRTIPGFFKGQSDYYQSIFYIVESHSSWAKDTRSGDSNVGDLPCARLYCRRSQQTSNAANKI